MNELYTEASNLENFQDSSLAVFDAVSTDVSGNGYAYAYSYSSDRSNSYQYLSSPDFDFSHDWNPYYGGGNQSDDVKGDNYGGQLWRLWTRCRKPAASLAVEQRYECEME